MDLSANIIEVFSSIQGEGPYAGEQQLFVRFQGCSFSCKFCDTPTSFIENPYCRIETQPFAKHFSRQPNPLSLDELNHILTDFPDTKTIAVTGGEPLESADFLQAWLSSVAGHYRILLETAGIHHEALVLLLPYVDVISMDVKLPSVTGMRAYWLEHRQFLNAAGEKELYVKVVVSAETELSDLDAAIDLVAMHPREIPFILQPASAFAQFRAIPSPGQVQAWHERAAERLPDVRVIPQLHKLWHVM